MYVLHVFYVRYDEGINRIIWTPLCVISMNICDTSSRRTTLAAKVEVTIYDALQGEIIWGDYAP
jgi:hypothetical protein